MWCDVYMMWYVMWCLYDVVCDVMFIWWGMWCDVYMMRYVMWCLYDVMWYVMWCAIGCDTFADALWRCGEKKHSITLVSACWRFWGMIFTSASRPPNPFRWDRMTRGGCSWVFPFPKIGWALVKPQQVRCWQNSPSWGQTSLRRTECSSVFHSGYLSLLPAGSGRGFFFDLHQENLQELLKLRKGWGFPQDWVPLRVIHSDPPVTHQLWLRDSSLSTGSQGHFCSSKLWFSVILSLSLQFRGSGFPCNLSYWQTQKSCWFSDCKVFPCKDGQLPRSSCADWKADWKAPLRCPSWDQNAEEELQS